MQIVHSLDSDAHRVRLYLRTNEPCKDTGMNPRSGTNFFVTLVTFCIPSVANTPFWMLKLVKPRHV